MHTSNTLVHPALSSAEALVRNMERHVGYLQAKLRSGPATAARKLEAELGAAMSRLAARRADMERVRSDLEIERVAGKQLAMF